jgi:hypothetical protein
MLPMAKRGRVSMSELTTPVCLSEVTQRPNAPYDLTDQEADEWRAIVATMPADHFSRCNYPILTQLCRHVVASRRVAQLAEAAASKQNFERREYMILLQMQATESAAIMRLSRSMRLTQQATKRSEVASSRPLKSTRPPWEDVPEDP